MPEVAHAGEDHGDAAFVGGGDDFGVADGAAGLDDAGCAGVGQHVQAVAEREEGVAGGCGAGQAQAGVLRFDAGDAGRVQAAHLACADADGHAVLAEDDGVAFDVLGHLPGKEQV